MSNYPWDAIFWWWCDLWSRFFQDILFIFLSFFALQDNVWLLQKRKYKDFGAKIHIKSHSNLNSGAKIMIFICNSKPDFHEKFELLRQKCQFYLWLLTRISFKKNEFLRQKCHIYLWLLTQFFFLTLNFRAKNAIFIYH